MTVVISSPQATKQQNTHKPVEIFFSYCHTDEKLRDTLEKHLSILKHQGEISSWHDRRIIAGAPWKAEIDKHLERAQVILLLVSADFLASNYCYEIEMKRAIARHDANEACVIPVILKYCDWYEAPFGKLQALPRDAKPVTQWADLDEAFTDIAKGIKAALKNLPVTFAPQMAAKQSGELIITASFDDFDAEKIAQLLEVLKRVSGDTEIKIKMVKRGSVIVELEGSEEAIRHLVALSDTGELSKLLGYEVKFTQTFRTTKQVKPNSRFRGVRFTIQAFEMLENALMQWWETAEEAQGSRTQKLTREQKALRLGLQVKTWDKLRGQDGVDRATLQHAFEKMGLHWKDDYCILVAPEEAEISQLQGSVPGLPTLLLGRETALQELRERLRPDANALAGSSSQKIVIVRGWPGVGKTTLTAAIARDGAVRSAYPDGTLWTSLGTEPDVRAALAAWGRQLGAEQIGRAGSLEEASAQLAGLLRDRRFLLIVDDVWQAEAAHLLLVGGRKCAALITTRDKGVAQSLAPRAEDVYRLAELEPEFAIELLQALAPAVVAQHRGACLALCRELENLPLALQVAGRLLHREAETGLEVGTLLSELREGTHLLEQKPPPDRLELMRETTPTVAVLLQKSTDRLDASTRECFALLGPFAPKPATFELDALRYVWELDDPVPVARTLVERGLLETVGPGRYQMHALLAIYARSLLTEEFQY